MKLIKYTFERNMTCKIPCDCSDKIAVMIETENFKVVAQNETDTVHGYISINHIAGKHKIDVYIYDSDEKPNSKHASNQKKSISKPSKSILNRKIMESVN